MANVNGQYLTSRNKAVVVNEAHSRTGVVIRIPLLSNDHGLPRGE